ncbi:MAG: hypothetical protein Kow00127_11940 [Bacteroidales bacterium]
MKRILLFAFAIGFALTTMAQTRVMAPKELRDYAVKKEKPVLETMNFSHEVLPAAENVSEDQVGYTRYDLQTNSSMQNRIQAYPDGTIGVVFTYGVAETAFPGRGTGYNYFDGSAWGELPTGRIETDRTGWPAYADYGPNGEVVLSHYSGAAIDGLALSIRTDKGTGDWTHIDYFGPAGYEGLLWPRMATGGEDNSVIHMIPLTKPTGNGGAIFEGMDGALLYSRSTDGGQTWDPQNVLLDDINATYYDGIGGDVYEIQARGDVVAFLIGDSFLDLVLMKSTDGGDTWEKTLIWTNPYPHWTTGLTDTFYCSDGAHALAIDQTGKVHVAFGINRAYGDDAGSTFWFPFVDGLGYWNEDRPTFSDNINSLNPYGHEDSELIDDYSLIGWAQDVNGNGEWDVLDEIGTYYVGASSMPTIHVDDNNHVYVVYSSVTETFDNGVQNYRHLWARVSPNGGEWWSPFVDLTGDFIHSYDECVFPSISDYSDDNIYLCYQLDSEPGLAVRGDEDPYGDNYINFMKVPKADFATGVASPQAAPFEVGQNVPNPANGTTTIPVMVHESVNLTVEVTNMMGQVVYSRDLGQVAPGMNRINIDASNLSNGVYFYTVQAGETRISRKMIVE